MQLVVPGLLMLALLIQNLLNMDEHRISHEEAKRASKPNTDGIPEDSTIKSINFDKDP